MTYLQIPQFGGDGPGGGVDFTGLTNGQAIPAGDIGEIVSASKAAENAGATGVFKDCVELALMPGHWIIKGVVLVNENDAILENAIEAGISTEEAPASIPIYEKIVLPFNFVTPTITVPVIEKTVQIAITTTYYINTKLVYASGNPQHGGYLEARRYR